MLAKENSYTNITEEQAYHLIESYPLSDILILEVRNDTEYKFAHLYDALQIPCHLLEPLIAFYWAMPNATIIDWRSVKLMEYIDSPVIVYCAGGYRSSIACNILSEQGFSEVYNIVGGIESWLQADFPIYNTAHDITVDRNRITIHPWASFQCACGTYCGSDEESIIQNRTLDITEQTENFTQGNFSFEYNGTTYDNTASATTIWNYTDSDHNSNLTATFELLQSAGSVNRQDYLLKYQTQNAEYNFSATTILQPLDANTYNASATVVRFIPTGKTEFLSIERVNFTSPVTLSELYSPLKRVCKDLARTYRVDGIRHNDDTLKDLADSYGNMADELKNLSNLVHKELRSNDLEIIQSTALLTDDYCWVCELVCSIFIGIVTCGPLDYFVVPAICIAAGIGTGGIAGAACIIIAGVIIGAICGFGVGLGCEAICEGLHYCGINYVDYCWAAPINGGHVTNKDGIIGEPDTYNYAEIYGDYANDGGHIVSHVSQLSSGGIIVRVNAIDPTTLWIYVSLDNDFWELVTFAADVYTWGYWDDIWGYSEDPYNYVAVSAYSFNHGCFILIDAISVNY